MRSDGVDIFCTGGLVSCKCLVKDQREKIIKKVEGDFNEKVSEFLRALIQRFFLDL